jgi:hypothetical protein
MKRRNGETHPNRTLSVTRVAHGKLGVAPHVREISLNPFRNPLVLFRYKPFTPRRPWLASVRAADSPRVRVDSLGFAVPVAGEGGVVSWRRRLRGPSRSQGSHPFLFPLSMLFDPSA